MCGIAGLIDVGGAFGPDAIGPIAADMGLRLSHRGPDGAGLWVAPDGRCALAHRRLAVVDPSPRGHQPMCSADGAAALSFNGEIYNFRELRSGLAARGWRFRSETDSEVLLATLAEADPRALADLDGMYAFALWNARRRRLLLARDPFGQKPLYWTTGTGWWAFASELGAFDAIPGFVPAIDEAALAEYLLLQYVHAPRTIYRGVHKLPPGTWLTLDCAAGGASRQGLGRLDGFAEDLATRAPPLGGDARGTAAAAEALRPVLIDALEHCLISDVPLGAFLSGGIDSALLVALMRRELGIPVQTFSVGFEGAPDSEHGAARATAAALGTRHHERILAPDIVSLIPRIAAALDEPLGDTSCLPTFLLSAFARERVTVALSGDGGDELFGGYQRYTQTLEEARDWRLRLGFLRRSRRPWRPGRAYCDRRWLVMTPAQVAALAGVAAGDHAQRLVADWGAQVDGSDAPLIHRLRGLDSQTYLPGAVLAKVDRMSMASALEVRAPMLNRSVAAFAARLPAALVHHPGISKPVLRALLARYLPPTAVHAPKRGFGLPPGAWAGTALLELYQDAVLGAHARLASLLDTAALGRLVRQWRRAGPWWTVPVWNLLMLELWLRARHEKGAGDGAA